MEQHNMGSASLFRALRRGFGDAWDRLGLVVAGSLAWSLSVFIPLAAAMATRNAVWVVVGVVAAWILGSVVMVGVCRMAYRVAYSDDASISDLLTGVTEMRWAALGIAGINLVIVVVLVGDSAFLLGRAPLAKTAVWAISVGVLSLYALAAWALSLLYQIPILVAQRPLGQREGVLIAIKKSWLPVIGNPVFTIGLFVVILGFGILCALSVIGMLILYAGVTSMVLAHALRELYISYGVIEEPPGDVEDSGWRIQ